MRMQRSACIIVLLLVLSVVTPLSAGDTWTTAYTITIDGFSSGSVFLPQEHLGLHAHISLFDWSVMNPSLSIGALAPLFANENSVVFEAALAFRLFSIHSHPFVWLFRRDSVMIPSIRGSYMVDLYHPERNRLRLMIQPLTFSFGEKIISILGFGMALTSGVDDYEWSLRLLEITHYFD